MLCFYADHLEMFKLAFFYLFNDQRHILDNHSGETVMFLLINSHREMVKLQMSHYKPRDRKEIKHSISLFPLWWHLPRLSVAFKILVKIIGVDLAAFRTWVSLDNHLDLGKVIADIYRKSQSCQVKILKSDECI